MIAYVVFVLLSVLWLSHRLFSIFQIPINSLIQTLNINIPRVPIISITKVATHSIFFHWEPTLEKGAGNHYRLFLNGAEIGIADYNQHSCVLKNLKPDSYYQIDVIAVYGSNFKSKSSTIYVKTYKHDTPYATIQHENPENIVNFLTKSMGQSSQLNFDSFKHKNTLANGSNTLRSRSNTLMMNGNANESVILGSVSESITNVRNRGVNISGDNDKKGTETVLQLRIKEIEQLKQILESGQDELRTITDQQSKLMQEFVEKNKQLRDERDRQRQLKKSGDRTRQSIRSEGKILEENTRYSRKDLKTMDNEIANIEADSRSKETQMKKWELELAMIVQRKAEIKSDGPVVKKNLQSSINSVTEQIQSAQAANIELDDNMRKFVAQRRSTEKKKESLLTILQTIHKNTKKNGSLSEEGNKALEQLLEVDNDVGQNIKHEISVDTEAAATWDATQKFEVAKCGDAYTLFHASRKELEVLTSKKLERTLESINKSASEREQQQKQLILLSQQRLKSQQQQQQYLQQQQQQQLQQQSQVHPQSQPQIQPQTQQISYTNSLLNNAVNPSKNRENPGSNAFFNLAEDNRIPTAVLGGSSTLPSASNTTNFSGPFNGSAPQIHPNTADSILNYSNNGTAQSSELINAPFLLWNNTNNNTGNLGMVNSKLGLDPSNVIDANGAAGLNFTDDSNLNAPLESPSVESYLPRNLFDNVLDENFLKDMRQYRHNVTDQVGSSGSSPMTDIDSVHQNQSPGLYHNQLSKQGNSFDLSNTNVGEISVSGIIDLSKLLQAELNRSSVRSSMSDTSPSAGSNNLRNNVSNFTSGFSSVGSADFLAENSGFANNEYSDGSNNFGGSNGNSNSHSITSALSPKRLFGFNRKQPSISITSGFNYEMVTGNGTEMVTNSNNLPTIFSDNSAVESDALPHSKFFGKKDESNNNSNAGFTNKTVSRFFGRKSAINATNNHSDNSVNDNNTQSNEAENIPTLSLTTPDDSGFVNTAVGNNDDTIFNIGAFAAPGSLRVRERSGSINSGVLIPQSFHTAQVKFNSNNPGIGSTSMAPNLLSNTSSNFWGQSNQSTSSIFYPTTSNNYSLRGPSFDNDNLFAAKSNELELGNKHKDNSNGWSLFHLNRNNTSTANEDDSIDSIGSSSPASSPFFENESTQSAAKSNATRMLFFRSKDKDKHEVNSHSPLGLSNNLLQPTSPPILQNSGFFGGFGIPSGNGNANSPVFDSQDVSIIPSPSQRKRRSIFSFPKSKNSVGNESIANSEQIYSGTSSNKGKHGSNLSLADTAITTSTNNDLAESDLVAGKIDDNDNDTQDREKDKDKSSKTSKLFPKSMRGLGISRRSSNTSAVTNTSLNANNSGGTASYSDDKDNHSVSTSAKSTQNERISSIQE